MTDDTDPAPLPPMPPQHPGGLIWEPHQGRMRITPETDWGPLAATLLPLARDAAADLANPQLQGANIHPAISRRASRLAGLLEGGIAQVAERAAAVYMASMWLAEKLDTDTKLRGAKDPLGMPLSDDMRAALTELMTVLPALARQFPTVLTIEDEREAFFATAANLTATRATAQGARQADLILPEDEAPLQEGVDAAGGAGHLAEKAARASVRSVRNLVGASLVVGVMTGFVGGEMMGGVGDAFGVSLRASTEVFVRSRRSEIAELFADAPMDQRQAVDMTIDALLDRNRTPRAKPGYKTYVVDPENGKGDFQTITAAIAAAEAGSKIVVREGTYREALRLSKPLEITGEGDRERILVVTNKGDALHCDAPMARISGMRFRREAGGKDYAVWITAGAAEIEDCVVESLSSACVGVSGAESSPSLRRCILREGAQGGLFAHGGAQVVAEDCQMLGNALSGVEVKGSGTQAQLRRCSARDGKQGGFAFHEGAGGTMEGCEAVGNAYSGVAIETGADPLLRECRLRGNRQAGVLVYKAGRGRLENCVIEENGRAGVVVQEGGAPVVERCTIGKNGHEAVWIQDAASTGNFRDNDLRGNTRGAWNIAEGAKVERSGNKE